MAFVDFVDFFGKVKSSRGSPRSGDHLADGSAIVDFFDKVKGGRRRPERAGVR